MGHDSRHRQNFQHDSGGSRPSATRSGLSPSATRSGQSVFHDSRHESGWPQKSEPRAATAVEPKIDTTELASKLCGLYLEDQDMISIKEKLGPVQSNSTKREVIVELFVLLM